MGMISRLFGNRQGSADAERAMTFDDVGQAPYGRVQNSLFGEATSYDSRIPHYRTPSPLEQVPDQRRLRSIARHLARTNPRIESILQKKVEITVGATLRPKTRYRELADLFMASCDQFDTRDETDFAGLISELYTNFVIDGDAILRRRVRRVRSHWSDLQVPMQIQSLTCDWCPDDHEGIDANGNRYVNGVAVVNDRKVGFAIYSEHPTDAQRYGRVARIGYVPASEIYHLFRSPTGVPRGHVPMTSVISTAEDLADLEAFAATRRKNATAMATFLEQAGSSVDAAPPIMGETDTKKSSLTKWMQNLFIRPGDTVLLPPGVKANMQAPAGEMPGHDTAVKTQAMLICAVLGIPYFEAMGDWKECPERAMRYAGAALKRRVVLDRKRMEKQVLNRLWRDFVQVAMATGMWTPPPGATMAEIYAVSWSWTVVQQAALDRELTVMLAMVNGGVIPPSLMTEDYFGLEFEDVARRWAHDAAVSQVTGGKAFAKGWQGAASEVSKRILAEAEEMEAHERDLVDEAKLDRSILGSPSD